MRHTKLSEQFLAREQLDSGMMRQSGGDLVVEHHTELSRILREAGEDPTLFATPILGRSKEDGSRTISWYTTRSGTAHRLDELDGAMREDVGLRLEEMLGSLQRRLEASDLAEWDRKLLRQALCVADPSAVRVVGGHPVLTGWGLGPTQLGPEPEAAQNQFDTVLGGLGLAWRGAPAAGADMPEPVSAAQMPADAAEESTGTIVGERLGAAGAKPSSNASDVMPAQAQPVAAPWWPVWVLAGLCLLLIALLLWLLWAKPVWPVGDNGAAALEQRAQALEARLADDVCIAEANAVGLATDGTLTAPAADVVTPVEPGIAGDAATQETAPLGQGLFDGTSEAMGSALEGIAGLLSRFDDGGRP